MSKRLVCVRVVANGSSDKYLRVPISRVCALEEIGSSGNVFVTGAQLSGNSRFWRVAPEDWPKLVEQFESYWGELESAPSAALASILKEGDDEKI